MTSTTKKLPLRSFMSPGIANIKGKSYLMINNGTSVDWVEVPYGYELEDVYKEFEYITLVPKSTKNFIEKSKVVKSKTSNNQYKVVFRQYDNGKIQFECSCPGATYRGKCKHIEEYKKQLKIK